MSASIVRYFSTLLIITGCGSDLFVKDEKKDSPDDLIFSITYDPAEFYSFADTCSPEMQKGGKKTTYNHKDEIIKETVCAWDAASKIVKKTSRRKNQDQLKESSYSEATLNDAGRIISIKEWDDSTKAKLTEESTFTYNADGKLTTSLQKNNDGKTTVTTNYADDETPVTETRVSTFGTTTNTTVTTCIGTLFFRYAPCEETINGKVTEKLTKEGQEFIRTELINDAMVETERFTELDGILGHYAKYTRKSYSSITAAIEYEETSECVPDGNKLTCTEKHKKPSGAEYYTYNSTYENFGTIRITIGSLATDYRAFGETSGNFALKKDDSELSGTMTGTIDSSSLNGESKISVQIKTASHPDLGSSFASVPFWGATTDSVDDIFLSTVKDATATFTSFSTYDGQKREIATGTKDLTGLTPEQISPEFAWREVSSYE